ncbi:MAG: hypothetical protein MI810_06780 [Flavobacteriales bacterium]|jgi:hypothetical protein|nr:hypothetical protein [Flavobacteriales bacterium]
MAKKENSKDKKLKALLSDLSSADAKKQLAAVKSLKVHGNETVIDPLLETYISTDDERLKLEITDLLNTLKSASVPPVIAKALMNKKYAGIRQMLLASIWNSGLDYNDHLREIISAASQGDMMEALECITIIENIEGTLTEDQLFEPILVLKEYLVQNRDEQSPKMDMLKEIALILQQRNDAL